MRVLEADCQRVAKQRWEPLVCIRESHCAVRRAAVVLAGIGLVLWSLSPAAAPLSTKLPPPSSTVFECSVDGIPTFTDQPCSSADDVEIDRVAHAGIQTERADHTPIAADVQLAERDPSKYALLLAGVACIAYLLVRRSAK